MKGKRAQERKKGMMGSNKSGAVKGRFIMKGKRGRKRAGEEKGRDRRKAGDEV